MKIGYVRVSDHDQTENLQIDALKAVGCEIIYGDHGVSGAISERKPHFRQNAKLIMDRLADTLIATTSRAKAIKF